MKFFANIFSAIGEFIANTTAGACFWSFVDEEEMPTELR